MFIYRLIYAFTLAIAIIFYLVYTPWFSWFLLVIILILVPLDLVISLPGMLTKSVNIEAPVFLEQYANGLLTITAVHTRLPRVNLRIFDRIDKFFHGAKQTSPDRRRPKKIKPFPVRCLYIKLRITGDDFVVQFSALNAAGNGDRSEAVIDTAQTGLSVIEIHRLYAVSLLGLFSMRIRTNAKASVLVMPPPVKPANTVELPRGLILIPKPGGGFSEEHDVRGYQPGDPIKSMHWKLSAKLDTPIIREPLIPPQQSRLVHIMPWESAAERDSTLSHLRWVSEYLIKMGLKFYARFGDRQLIEEVSDEADLVNFLCRALDSGTVINELHNPRITRFSWIYKVSGNSAVTGDEK